MGTGEDPPPGWGVGICAKNDIVDTASENVSQNVTSPRPLGRGKGVGLTSAYFAPLAWYVPLAKGANVCMEQHDNFVKQTFRNRCIITGPNGRQVLTVPVEKNAKGKTSMRDVRISDHGNWRHLHWNALESSYGKSPFFEYYADDLRPFFEKRWDFLFDFNEEIRQTVCELLQIEAKVTFSSEFLPADRLPEGFVDLRPLAEPSVLDEQPCPPYYQVFAQRHGFTPNLSILDLLFNLGPEALIYLTAPTPCP